MTARGVCHLSVVHRRPLGKAKLKDWNVKANYAVNKADAALQGRHLELKALLFIVRGGGALNYVRSKH